MSDFAAFLRPISTRTKKLLAILSLLALTSVAAEAQLYCCGWTFYMYSPSAGSQFTRGTSTVYINWGWSYNPSYIGHTVSVDFSSNGGTTWNNITTGLFGGQNFYNWAIPISQTPGTNYRVRVIEDLNANWGTTYFNEPAMSGVFTILPGCAAPTIATQPQTATVCSNTSHTFSVVSDMTDGTYAWRKDGATIATTTTPTYTINPVTTASAGSYSVVLTQNCNTTFTRTSNAATLNVNVPPSITQQPPATLAICQSGRDTLKARGIGVGRTFRWQKDGVDIPNATDSNLVIDNAQLPTQGAYRLVITGTCAPPAISNATAVNVVIRPSITTEPSALALCPGSTGQLSVVASGPNLSYQWYRNGAAIPGAASTLPFTNYSTTQDGMYHVVVISNVPNPTNCQLTVTSRIVTVTGYRPPTMVKQPTAVEGCVGKSASLTSEFEGFGLAYTWTKNGSLVANNSSNSLLLNNLTTADAGDYVVTATATCGLTSSSVPVRMNVVKTPTFSAQPQSKDLTVGQPLNLTIAASDATNIKWFKDAKVIVGQTAATFNIASVTLADAGYYHATVTNTCSGIASAYARVTVIDPSTLQPRLTLSSENVDFGEIPVGYDASRTLTNLIQNSGTVEMQVTDLMVSNSSGFAIATAPATPFTIAPGGAQTITIRANAESVGPMVGTLTVTTNAPIPTGMVNLTASQVLRYDAPSTVEYGAVMATTTRDRCITVMNNSTTNISLEQATISGPNANVFSIVTPMPVSIAAGGSSEVCVKFAPIEMGQNLTAVMNITSSTGGNSTVTLLGTGTEAVDVADLDESVSTVVYPNPANDEVSIRTEFASTITIVNARGVKVATLSTTADRLVATWNTKNTNGAAVSAGTYTVRISGQQGSVTIPLVIVR